MQDFGSSNSSTSRDHQHRRFPYRDTYFNSSILDNFVNQKHFLKLHQKRLVPMIAAKKNKNIPQTVALPLRPWTITDSATRRTSCCGSMVMQLQNLLFFITLLEVMSSPVSSSFLVGTNLQGRCLRPVPKLRTHQMCTIVFGCFPGGEPWNGGTPLMIQIWVGCCFC